MIKKKEFKQALNALFQDEGFVNKGQSWFLLGEDVTVVINSQKSDYDEKYYLNIGLWLNFVVSGEFTQHNHCHIQGRIESLFLDQWEIFDEGGSLDNGSERKLEGLIVFLHQKVAPFCRLCLDKIQLKTFFADGRFSKLLISKAAKDALGN